MISKIKAHTKSTYRFESCPDYEEMVIFLYGIQSFNLENLPDSVERHAHGYVVEGHPYNTLYGCRFKSCHSRKQHLSTTFTKQNNHNEKKTHHHIGLP